MQLLLCGKGGRFGGWSRWPVFITQFPVLHDVKKTCLFARNSQKYWYTSAWVPLLSSWLLRALGVPSKLFSSEGALGFSPCLSPSLFSSSSIKG